MDTLWTLEELHSADKPDIFMCRSREHNPAAADKELSNSRDTFGTVARTSPCCML